jgi:hypothetical protein
MKCSSKRDNWYAIERRCRGLASTGSAAEPKAVSRGARVVMVDVLSQHAFKMASTQNDQPIQAVGCNYSSPSPGSRSGVTQSTSTPPPPH